MAGASHGGVGKGLVKSWIGPFHSFALGNESIPEVKIAFADLYAGHVVRIMGELQASLLGADFLRSHRILVSYSQCKLYFTYVGGPVFYTASPPLSPPR